MARDRTHDSTFDWWFRNRKTGRITVGEPANLPIKIVTITTLVGVLLPRGTLRERLGEVAVLALAWWAVDEAARGVNPYRRSMGGVALAGLGVLAIRGRRDSKPRRRKKST